MMTATKPLVPYVLLMWLILSLLSWRSIQMLGNCCCFVFQCNANHTSLLLLLMATKVKQMRPAHDAHTYACCLVADNYSWCTFQTTESIYNLPNTHLIRKTILHASRSLNYTFIVTTVTRLLVPYILLMWFLLFLLRWCSFLMLYKLCCFVFWCNEDHAFLL